ncbi:hypothetical protein Ocin01_07560 [Orchesella cincta]|uniref:Uncharacterized protein n=1 Tax=Orchesella cincta TaxID=48709 RepID=A0A1D2N1K8_ORCCI|nr:hypothetical protein Ocin01_07560 [Orchesella cincta]
MKLVTFFLVVALIVCVANAAKAKETFQLLGKEAIARVNKRQTGNCGPAIEKESVIIAHGASSIPDARCPPGFIRHINGHCQYAPTEDDYKE